MISNGQVKAAEVNYSFDGTLKWFVYHARRYTSARLGSAFY